jgi:hypothetical protein
MGRTKYVNPKKRANKINTNLTKTRRKTPIHNAFNFIEEPDIYYVHIPDNYIDNENFPEDAQIKQLFINDIIADGIDNKKLSAGQLNGICKDQHELTQNLIMQSNGNIVLYIEKNGDVKAAITIGFNFYTSEDAFLAEEEEEEEEEIPWRISQINILTFCSKVKGYGTKLINKLINIFYVGLDNDYILNNAKILLNYTPTSKPFYEKLGFDCTDTKNELCFFDANKVVPEKYRSGGKTNRRKTNRRKTNRRKPIQCNFKK